MIEEIFATLGFKEEEVKTYLSLLDAGPSSGGDLAKKMGMKRPTVYGYLDRLVVGGLATQSSRNGLKLYIAASTEQIQLLFQRKKDELLTKEKAFEQIVPELQKRVGMNLFQPKIQIFEGHEGIRNAMGDLLNYEGVQAHTIWPIQSMLDVLSPDYLRYHNIVRIQKKIKYNSIWEHNQATDIDVPNYLGTGERYYREIRIAPNNFKFEMGVQFYANKVVFLSSKAESFALMIESKEIFDVQFSQFKMIWDVAETFDVTPKGADLFFEDVY